MPKHWSVTVLFEGISALPAKKSKGKNIYDPIHRLCLSVVSEWLTTLLVAGGLENLEKKASNFQKQSICFLSSRYDKIYSKFFEPRTLKSI
ncbi:MAG TPA: hypothetical protein VFN23_19300, partial [Ktedonobacteraceae bacterium]|nr:hypothetical protein [Ktedonobacteraceae bacterium]